MNNSHLGVMLLIAVLHASCESLPDKGNAVAQSDTLTTRTLRIVDSSGRERIRLGSELVNGRPAIMVNYENGSPAILCGICETDAAGSDNNGPSHDAAFIDLEAPNGDASFSAHADDDGTGISLDWLSKFTFSIQTTRHTSVLEITPSAEEAGGSEKKNSFLVRITCDAEGHARIELQDATGHKTITTQ